MLGLPQPPLKALARRTVTWIQFEQISETLDSSRHIREMFLAQCSQTELQIDSR